jgi:coenzyme F420-reducing hydrogenase alpha subunit
VVLQPLTRVEGHGRVELILHEGHLHQVRLALTESPRLFEKLVIGRSATEIPDLVCRICAICSAVHKLAALTAIERALAIEIPPAARLIRELLLLGGHLQSHALHLFCLILPDFTVQASIFDLVRQGDPLAIAGLELKAFGNRVQELAGGRVIHPVNAVLGGVVGRPADPALSELQRGCDDWLNRWPRLAAEFAETARYPQAAPVIGTPLATGGTNRFTLSGEALYLKDGGELPVEDYVDLLEERAAPHSRARQSAGSRGPFLVGALARQRLWQERSGGESTEPPSSGIHDNNTAQLAEIGWTLARMHALLAEVRSLAANPSLTTRPGALGPGVGTAAFEAPRGLLIHHYVIDDWGQVAVADIVTPTAINQLTMERQLFADLAHVDDEAELRSRAERIVRAYDPCISCAVHVIQC